MNDVITRELREALGDTGRQCTATNRAGERCGRAPVPGCVVCSLHGGKVPAVQKAGRERLLAMVEPALDALLRFLRTAPPCEHCGRSDADRDPLVLRAAQIVLDRTGMHPKVDVQVQPPPRTAAHIAWIPTERLEQIAAWHAEATAAMERGEPIAEEREWAEQQAALAAASESDPPVDAVLIEGEGDEPQGLAPLGVEPNDPQP
jgi:hypothetical protein